MFIIIIVIIDKTYLSKPIEWKPAKYKIGKEFNNGEKGKYNPIG